MRWARRTVATAFAGSGCRQPTARRAEACRQEPPRYPRAWPAGVSVVLGLGVGVGLTVGVGLVVGVGLPVGTGLPVGGGWPLGWDWPPWWWEVPDLL